MQAVKRLALAPGLEATTTLNAVALRAAILGKFIGAATTVATLNYLISGHARGYQGTKIGAVSWKDDEGKVHQFDVAGLLGATTGARRLGLMQAAEAKERNLANTTAAAAGARGLTTTLISQFAGPAVRAVAIGATGKDPYGNQIADVSPQGNDPVKNITAALVGANPLVEAAVGIHDGRPWSEVWQRQLTRFSPSTPSSLATSDRFTEVVTKKNLMEYADWLATRARKLPQADRAEFVRKRLAADNVTGPSFKEVQAEVKRKGTYRYK